MMAKVLELQFETETGKTATIAIDAPKPNVTSTDIQQVMQTIITSNWRICGYKRCSHC